jgi:hypothetical protein
MIATELHKPIPVPGLMGKLFRRTRITDTLDISLAASSEEQARTELASVRNALLEWGRAHADAGLVVFEIVAPPGVMEMIQESISSMMLEDPEVLSAVGKVRVEMSCTDTAGEQSTVTLRS